MREFVEIAMHCHILMLEVIVEDVALHDMICISQLTWVCMDGVTT